MKHTMQSRRRRISAAAVSLAAVTAMIAGCSAKTEGPDAEGDMSLENVVESGVLRVGLSATLEPFEYVDSSGEIVGLDVDLANEIAKKLGVEAKPIDTKWDGVVASLTTGQFDVIISAMTVNEDRAKRVLFTQPYGDVSFVFMTKDGTLTKPADFNGKVVSVEGGGAGQETAERWQSEGLVTFKDILTFTSPAESFLAVETGRSDAAIDSVPATNFFMLDNPGYTVVDGFGPPTDLAIAVAPDAAKLCLAINDALSEIKASGDLEKMQKQWLGFTMESRDSNFLTATCAVKQ